MSTYTGVEWWYHSPSREYRARYGTALLRVPDVDIEADARRAHPIAWPVMSSAAIDQALMDAWQRRLDAWLEATSTKPPQQ